MTGSEPRDSESPPFVSVIVALYNEEENLELCTQALFRQSYPADRFEIILVDDGSEDDSPRICREIVARRGDRLPAIRHLPIEHAGLSVGRNSGIAASRGDLIAFIDADATADERWVEAIVEAFEDESVAVIGGRIDPLNAESRLAHFFAAIHYDRSAVIGCNMAYRPEVFRRVGGFCPVFTYRGDEANLLRRIRNETDFKIEHVEAARVDHALPSNLKSWLRERWTSGRLWYHHRQVDQAYGGAARGWELYRWLLLRFVNLSILPLLPIALLSNSSVPWLLLLPVLLLTVARFIFPGTLPRLMFGTLKRRFGVLRACLLLIPGLMAIYLGELTHELGFIVYAAIDQSVEPGKKPFPIT